MSDEPVELEPDGPRGGLAAVDGASRPATCTPARPSCAGWPTRCAAVIDQLVATTAPEEALGYAADSLERLAAEFEQYPQGRTYEGFAEAANAGATSTPSSTTAR